MKKYWIIGVAVVLAAVGIILNYSGYDTLGTGKFISDYFAAGDFATGVFAAGNFAVGIFSIGIFSVDVFSIGIFNVSLFGLGIFVRARKRKAIAEKLWGSKDEE